MNKITTTSIMNQEYRLDIWRKLYSLILYGIEIMSSCLMFRVTLRYPEDIPYPLLNEAIVQFIDSFKKPFERNEVKILCMWVKEFSENSDVGNFHYHLWIIIDGHEVRNPFALKSRAEHFWGLAIRYWASGLAHIDEMDLSGSYTPHGIMVRKNSRDFKLQMAQVWEQAQYLAKSKSKKYYPYKSDAFGCSQVPQKSDKEADRKLFEILSGW